MRRITVAVMGTLSALVLLFSYRTSLGDGGTVTAQVVSPARIVTAAPATTTAGAGPDPRPAAASSASSATTAPSTAGTSRPSAGSSSSNTSSGAPSSSAPTSAAAGPVTVQGAAEMTRYGAVQVEVTIDGGAITDVTAIDYPNTDGRDQEINARAVPQLQNQVLSAQSAGVQGVSGATYTTEGFLASVQSALDAAGFTS